MEKQSRIFYTLWYIFSGILALTISYLSSQYNYLLFHTLAELFSVIIAVSIFIIAWNTRQIMDNNYLFFLGTSYFFVAVLDLLHTLTYKGMPIFTGYGTNLPTQLWIAARYLQSLSLLIAPFCIKRKMHTRLFLGTYTVVVFLLVVSIFRGIFPACFLEESGLTLFKIFSEYVICLLLFASIIVLLRKRQALEPEVLRFVLASIIVTILQEVTFTFYVDVYGLSNLFGHFLKILSFYLLYKALIETGLRKPYHLLFRNLKQNEARLQHSEATARALLNTPRDVMLLVDPNGILLDLNEMCASRFSLRVKDLRGMCVYDLFPAELVRSRKARVEKVIQTGQSLRFVDERQGIWNDNLLFPVLDTQGKVINIAIQAHDITEERKGEEQLRKLSTVVEQSPSMVVITDIHANIEYVNPKFTQITGYQIEEVLEKNSRILKSGKHAPEFYHQLWDTITADMDWRGEFCNKNKHGEIYWEAASISAIKDLEGNITHWVKIAEDVTEHKQAEEQLRHAREEAEEARKSAEMANQAKSQFIANMSHELRTPLNGILGYTQILKRDQHLTAYQHRAIGTIQRSGEYLLTIINDILNISKIETGNLELELIEFPLASTLATIIAIIRIQAQQKGLRLLSEQDPALPQMVKGDENRLHQILLNLLSNAVKFTETGSVILRVMARADRLNDTKKSDTALTTNIRFEIEDTGIGIPASELKAIFEPFHQVNVEHLHAEGTGLGLAISRKLVQKMGGQLRVSSCPGQGSIFWFELELPEASQKVRKKMRASPNIIGFKGNRRKVLCVDDEKENCVIIHGMLRPLGFDIIEANDGQGALSKVQEEQPDLIFMDLKMPVLDGFETTRRIRQISTLKDIPIIAISANAFETTRQESLAAGCDDFLTKPFHLEQLLDRLENHLHLEWAYEGVDNMLPIPEEQVLIPPSPEELAILEKLARRGDIVGLREWAAEIIEHDLKLVPFAEKLLRFAEEFQIIKIQQFIDSYMSSLL